MHKKTQFLFPDIPYHPPTQLWTKYEKNMKKSVLLWFSPSEVQISKFKFDFSYKLAQTYMLLNGFFQFLRADTDVSLGHIYTGMLQKGSHQFDIVVIIHIDIGGEPFTEAMTAYTI